MTTRDDTHELNEVNEVIATGNNLWVCVFQPMPGVDVPDGRRMAQLLKVLGRRYGMECRFVGDRVPLPLHLARKTPRPRKRREPQQPPPPPPDL